IECAGRPGARIRCSRTEQRTRVAPEEQHQHHQDEAAGATTERDLASPAPGTNPAGVHPGTFVERHPCFLSAVARIARVFRTHQLGTTVWGRVSSGDACLS